MQRPQMPNTENTPETESEEGSTESESVEELKQHNSKIVTWPKPRSPARRMFMSKSEFGGVPIAASLVKGRSLFRVIAVDPEKDTAILEDQVGFRVETPRSLDQFFGGTVELQRGQTISAVVTSGTFAFANDARPSGGSVSFARRAFYDENNVQLLTDGAPVTAQLDSRGHFSIVLQTFGDIIPVTPFEMVVRDSEKNYLMGNCRLFRRRNSSFQQ